MYHNSEIPESCLALWQTCHSLAPDLINNCSVKSSNLTVTASTPINPQSKSVYLIKSGVIGEFYDDQLIVNYEQGDLVGLDGLLQKKITTYKNDFAVIVDEYDGQTFIDSVYKDKSKFLKWNQFLSCLSQSYQLLMCHFNHQDIDFTPEFRYYNKGDTIIEQNTEGHEVYTLMSGTTKVLLDNTEVGTVKKDEIFGAIAALTNTKRNASVVATSYCEVIVVKSDNFRDLLTARPLTVQALIGNMARTIVSCNEKIKQLSADAQSATRYSEPE
ncbi:MAG: cyclic nucleotide-binding domain-containing protein [Gammaproteobacteria bacterium]|nr:cyclic nucleotide-binding domain-containing protein [Gammaproteobacteria bacterium]